MTLREAIDRYCGEEQEAGSKKQEGGGKGAWKNWECDGVGNLRRAMGALELRRADALAMKETCEATVPLLQEMIEKQEDAGEMNRLFVEVDRLRSKVGNDAATFEMVTHLNTIGELRRFQADLGVKTVKEDSLERQRRQLVRDVDYVSNLKVGAERLLEIIDGAMGRLEKQVKAAERGGAWPREVAGGR